ncbi:hypothetical protein, partial [Delftia lacustris]
MLLHQPFDLCSCQTRMPAQVAYSFLRKSQGILEVPRHLASRPMHSESSQARQPDVGNRSRSYSAESG